MVGPSPNSIVARHMEHGHQHTHDITIKMHGIILTAAFSILVPFGIILIRSGIRQSFRFHWIVQLMTTLLAIPAMVVMVVRSWSNIIVSYLLFSTTGIVPIYANHGK
jgi:hypothetical protein